MPVPNDPLAILERIVNGKHTDADLEVLRQALSVNSAQNVVQIGKYTVNIGQGQDIQIGDHIYNGVEAEAIKAALRAVLQETRKADRPRNEKLLLTAVKQEVTVRLKQSLHNAVLINLGKEQQPEQVQVPWDAEIKIGSKPSEPLPDSTSILEVFDQEEIAGRLLILGNPGSGKTTAQLDLAKALIARAQQQSDYPIPVLFNLSSWKDDKPFLRSWLVAELKSKYGVRADVSTKWLDKRQLLPMLDGLDELEPKRQEPCVQAINQLLTGENPPLYLVVCSRSEEYANYETRLQLNGAICLQALTEIQIQDYLIEVNHADLWRNISQDPNLLALVRTPLLLSITILAYQEISSKQWQQLNSTEERLGYLLNAYSRRMLTRSIPSKVYASREVPSVRQTQFRLVWLAKQLQRESRTEFLIEKIQPSWISDKVYILIYTLISEMASELVVWLTFGTALELFLRVKGSLIYSIAIGSIIIYFTVKNEKISREIEPSEILSWSFKKTLSRLIGGLITGITVGLAVGAILFLVDLLINLKTGFPTPLTLIAIVIFLASGLVAGPILGLSLALDTALDSSEIEIRNIPNQGIWRSARNAIIVGLIIGGFIGLFFGGIGYLVGGFIDGVLLGIISTLAFGLNFGLKFGGGKACIQHFTLRIILYLKGYIPWNYTRFLNYANECLLIQRSGGRYRFIHRLLQEHFSKYQQYRD